MSYTCDEYYAVYNEKVRTANKEHNCSACLEKIHKGDCYTYVSIVFDGTAWSVKRCARCQAIHEHLRALGTDSWPKERLDCGQSYEDEWGECPPEIEKLAFALPGEVT